MKFPITNIDKSQYINKIKQLLADDNCKIFLDTNIISQLFKIYSVARGEFYSWIEKGISKNKILIPSWSVNEYTNRFMKNKTSDYVGDLNKIKTINKELSNIGSFLEMYIDDESLIGTEYANNRNKYLEDFDLVIKTFGKIAKATQTGKDYLNNLNSELQAKFENVVMQSDIFEIVNRLHHSSSVRYHNTIPPGFEDNGKELNKYGDLIIWTEILDFCKSNEVKKAILITNDSKRDIVYKPAKVTEASGKSLTNEDIYLADPRIVYEFKLATNSEDFYIINFDTLVKILYSIENTSFQALSTAIQIKRSDSQVLQQKIEIPSNSLEVNIGSLIVNPENVDFDINAGITEDNKIIIPIQKVHYSINAKADKNFQINEENIIGRIIEKLKSYTWDVQNQAIDMLKKLNFKSLENNSENADLLFVLGRNIYQAACGNSFYAIQYLDNIEYHLSGYPLFVKEHMVNGLFYEIYYDSSNNFRLNDFKVGYISEVYKLESNPEYKININFIRDALEEYKDILFIMPNQEPDELEIEIIISDEIKSNHWTVYYTIEKLSVEDKSMIIDSREDVKQNFCQIVDGISWPSLLYQISRVFAIPEMKMNFKSERLLMRDKNYALHENKILGYMNA